MQLETRHVLCSGFPMFPWALSFYLHIASQSSLLPIPTATPSSWTPLDFCTCLPASHPLGLFPALLPEGHFQTKPSGTERRALPQSGTQGPSPDISSLTSCSAPGSWSRDLPEPPCPDCFLPQGLCTAGDDGSLSRPSSSSVLSPPRSAPARRDHVMLCMVIFKCVCWRGSGSWGRTCNKNRTTAV